MNSLNATPRKAGRPRKALDPGRVERVLQGIKIGLPFVHACARAGISEDTFARWRKQSADFAEAVKSAEAEAIARNVTVIQKAAGTSWQAAAWWLERRYPNEFAKTERLHHAGAEGKEVTLRVVYDNDTNWGA
jgi:hypothetical protein